MMHVLAGDIGGTNVKLAVFGKKLLFSMRFKSYKLDSIIPAINRILNYSKERGIVIKDCCLAVAGPIKECHVKPTNIKWTISVKEILKKTSLRNVKLINDFEAIGYGINLLKKKDLFIVRNFKGKGVKAIIGAGTGLGKAIIVDGKVVASEGGHGDFPATNGFELKLVNFIKKKRKVKQVNYEELISGRGIEIIYEFLTGKKAKAAEISKKSKETMKLYAKFYGRCCKNFVLESLARGGLYIAGGIAAKNKGLFESKEFLNEFNNADKLDKVLKRVPIYVVVNEDVGLMGAGAFGFLVI